MLPYLCTATQKMLNVMTDTIATNIERNNKRMTNFLGHSDNLITLSGARLREITTSFILRAGRPRQYTAFLASMQEKSACFLSPS